MKESANTALSFIKSHSEELGIPVSVFNHWDVHIHIPEGAIPKDGPSAGITMLTSLTSVYTQRKVEPYIAMTGEITLRGKVLPVGGIKEKILAAKRAGMKKIILCKANEKNLEEINKEHIKDLKIIYINNMVEVLDIALSEHIVPNAKKLIIKEDVPALPDLSAEQAGGKAGERKIEEVMLKGK